VTPATASRLQGQVRFAVKNAGTSEPALTREASIKTIQPGAKRASDSENNSAFDGAE